MSVRTANQAVHKFNYYAQLFETNLTDQIHTYYNKCACNEYDSLTRRHLIPHISNCVNPAFNRLEEIVMNIASMFIDQVGYLSKCSSNLVFKHTKGSLQKRYRRAYNNIYNNRIAATSCNANLKAFVKFEKMNLDKIDEQKPPRIIQCRSYEYLYTLKSYILDYSLKLKSVKPVYYNQQSVETIFTKLHNQYGIARVLRENWDCFSNPVALCLDHSKFDGHFSDPLLKLEHKFWNKLYNSRSLKILLEKQINQKGFTQSGLHYKAKGYRASGEYTTSDGNSLINYSMLVAYMEYCGINDFRISVNGDDSVIFIEHSNLHRVKSLDYFKNFNMKTEQDRIAFDFRDISYCQTQPVRVLHQNEIVWYMIKDYKRTISRMQYAESKYLQCSDRYLSGIALCELACSSGIPIMQSFAVKLYDLANASPLASVDRMPAAISGNDCETKIIQSITREDFQYITGLDAAFQISLENEISGKTNIKVSPKYKTFNKQNANQH